MEPTPAPVALGERSQVTVGVNDTRAGVTQARAPKGAGLALVLATIAFAINFWAWALISPLAKDPFGTNLGLTSFQIGFLVAIPILVGSLGRIPIGALTDRYGGRVMFAFLSFAVIVPVVFLAFFQQFRGLLAGGFVLGLGGTSFAVGVPYVSQWFPAEKRGFALGVYGMGNIGTAISVKFTPILYKKGDAVPFLVAAGALALIGILFLVVGRESPNRRAPTTSFRARLGAAVRMPVTWNLAVLYAITFGAFVAFGAYLPTYLQNTYGLDKVSVGTKAAGFVVLATLARPAGGWLSDRISGDKVVTVALVVASACAIVISTQGTAAAGSDVVGVPFAQTAAFLTLAACLGLGNGAIFALVGKRVNASQAGSVSGLVGAAGGLGGYFPPLVMGYVFGQQGNYTLGLVGLAAVALLGAAWSMWRVRERAAAG